MVTDGPIPRRFLKRRLITRGRDNQARPVGYSCVELLAAEAAGEAPRERERLKLCESGRLLHWGCQYPKPRMGAVAAGRYDGFRATAGPVLGGSPALGSASPALETIWAAASAEALAFRCTGTAPVAAGAASSPGAEFACSAATAACKPMSVTANAPKVALRASANLFVAFVIRVIPGMCSFALMRGLHARHTVTVKRSFFLSKSYAVFGGREAASVPASRVKIPHRSEPPTR
jgi:hypothetical protein